MSDLLTQAMETLKTIRKSNGHFMCRVAAPFDYRCTTCIKIDELMEKEAACLTQK